MSYNKGTAVHATNSFGGTWCSRGIPKDRRTNNPKKIDCKVCKRMFRKIKNKHFIVLWREMARKEAGVL